MSNEFDYIVVGAGSAGCVLANRLSEDGKATVLLLEAGPADRNLWLKIPAGFSRVFFPSKINWGYFTEPEPHLGGRKVYWPRGRTLGGSSSINGMVYTRGNARDYDNWAQMGCTGWSWNEVLPFFKKSEGNARGASEYHAADGPLSVQDTKLDDLGGRLFMQSAAEIGTPIIDDLNDGRQFGVSRPQITVRGSRRASTATEFLRPARSRGNLQIECEAHVQRVDLEGRKAVGVTYSQGGNLRSVKARREVILSGGVINSPQLLMLSGIGPAEHLGSVGIEVRHDLPGVGQNLQDHAYCFFTARTKREISWNHRLKMPRVGLELLNYLLTGHGVMNMTAVLATAYPVVGPGAAQPDVQISYRPISIAVGPKGTLESHPFPAVNASVSLLRPQARGKIELASKDPGQYPRMYANYFDNESDIRVMREGLRWIRRVFQTGRLAEYVAAEVEPGPDCQTDADYEAYIRSTSQTVHHQTSTCSMGTNSRAVVDPRLRVHGIGNLRVADASIMPAIVSSNTNAPTIMIAEKAAAMILEDWA
jgi:choline dehydrogenase